MSDYKRITYYSNEDNAFIVSVPELPGCVADGKTLEEALHNSDVCISEWIDTAKDIGRKVPRAYVLTKTRTNIDISDVAYAILTKAGNISTYALQKLLYYSQSWSLAWRGEPLFGDHFEAWIDGPVNPKIFKLYQGRRVAVRDWLPEHKNLNRDEEFIVNSVLSVYAKKDADWLSRLTHKEEPWIEARGGIPSFERCTNQIKEKTMKLFYGGRI